MRKSGEEKKRERERDRSVISSGIRNGIIN